MELRNCNKCFIDKTIDLFSLKRKACKECCNKYNREQYVLNREKYRETRKKWKKDNADKLREYTNEWFRKRKKSDPLFKMKCNLRTLLWVSFNTKKFVKKSKVLDMLGCDYNFFKEYIESKFTQEMNWNNIHIDHIKPLCLATTEEDVIKFNHYTNLQPLLARDNLVKNNKYGAQ